MNFAAVNWDRLPLIIRKNNATGEEINFAGFFCFRDRDCKSCPEYLKNRFEGVVGVEVLKLTVAEVRRKLEEEAFNEAELLALEKDPRASVGKLLQQRKKRSLKEAQEAERLELLFAYEKKFRQQGCKLIAGVDEAGRGPLAGPVVVAAVILPEDCRLTLLNDSKKLSAAQREALYEQINEKAIAIGRAVVERELIDEINIYQATIFGMYQSIRSLTPGADAVVIDAVPLPELTVPNESIIGGDALSASIAAASIIAKVERDRLMLKAAEKYPQYGFAKHKGYGTPEHLQALREYGPCPLHRCSFEPIKSLLAGKGG